MKPLTYKIPPLDMDRVNDNLTSLYLIYYVVYNPVAFTPLLLYIGET